jgi:N-acetylglucosaminyl-diphospho-decaprenol L-rhamnosyltransferase
MTPCPLSVVVVTHNHADFIGTCLDALLPEAAAIGAEVIVVDNRSDDASAAIAASFAGVRLMVAGRRQGFAANSNMGMAVARGRYLLLLNPDTEVMPGALAALVSFMDARPTVGLCGARLLYPNGDVQPSARRFPTPLAGLVRRTPLRALLGGSRANRRHLMLDDDLDEARPVDWLLGACMCVRRSALEQVGPLDEGYFLYVEDIDWARRMHEAGWEVYYVPQARIKHHHLAVSDRRFLSRRTLIHSASMVRYARKFWLRWLPIVGIRGYEANAWRMPQSEAPGDRLP